MIPFKIKLQSFKAFKDEATLNVKPLTLIYGHNQAGKSTLLRLLGLISDSMQPNAGPLDLTSPSLRGAVFKEMGWLGPNGYSITPRFSITEGANETSPMVSLQYAEDDGLTVNRVEMTHGENGDKFKVSLDKILSRSSNLFSASYAGKYKGKEWVGDLNFSSFIPSGLPEEAAKIAESVDVLLSPLKNMQWLRANRLADIASTDRKVRCCKSDGSDLATILRGEQQLAILSSVTDWFARQDGIGNKVMIAGASGDEKFYIGAAGRGDLPAHFAGEGVRALLPILLCAAWAESKDESAPSMLAVEEPEAHLHPTLQVELFDRLIATVQSGIPVVLETHSVYILRAMQVAVLEGRLSAQQVGLHWVNQGGDGAASVRAIDISDDAVLHGWLPLVFEREQQLAHKIIDLRWQKGRS